MAVYMTVFVGKAGGFQVRLFERDRPADLSQASRITLEVGNVLIDSITRPDAITWSTTSDPLDEETGVVTFSLGTILMTPMNYTPAYITLYDPGVPGGYLFEVNCSETELFIEVCAKASV